MSTVRGYAVIAVNKSLIVAGLECPHYAFHKACIHSFVRAVIVYPARHLLNVFLPSVVVVGNDLKALLVELVDTQLLLDLVLIVDSQKGFYLIFDRQTVAVPTPDSGNFVASHSPVSRYHILDKGNEYRAVVRLSGRERRTVIENYFLSLFIFNRLFKNLIVHPEADR